MKVLKKIETDMWINVIMMFLIGVLFIVRPQNSLESVAIIAGIIIFVNGIFDLFYDIKIWTDFYIRYSLFEGIMKCILGIFIATHAGIITILFSYVFSIYIIIHTLHRVNHFTKAPFRGIPRNGACSFTVPPRRFPNRFRGRYRP